MFFGLWFPGTPNAIPPVLKFGYPEENPKPRVLTLSQAVDRGVSITDNQVWKVCKQVWKVNLIAGPRMCICFKVKLIRERK